METVKQVLMRRDNMDADAADEMIEAFESELNGIIENGGNSLLMLNEAEDLIKDWFSLEPDYLAEFIC